MKLISLDEVPEEMYGGELPVAKRRKSKRKDLSEEEYLVEEQPSKKAKKSKQDKASEEGGFGLPTVEEEAERVLGKKTREGQEDAPSPVQAPRIPKKSRKKTIRKLEYISKANGESDQEINEMVDEVTNDAARDLVNEAMDFVRKEALDRVTVTATASEVIKAASSEATFHQKLKFVRSYRI